MKCSCTPAGVPAGQPFGSDDERLLWLAGYVNCFDTAEEAAEAAEAVRALPGMDHLSYKLVEG